jgi:hypothetical protein
VRNKQVAQQVLLAAVQELQVMEVTLQAELLVQAALAAAVAVVEAAASVAQEFFIFSTKRKQYDRMEIL